MCSAEVRYAGDLVSCSARALMSSGPLVSGAPSALVFVHGGNRPQRIKAHPRRLVVGLGVAFDHGA